MSKTPRNGRIYHGKPGRELEDYWTVAITNATERVVINGSLRDALDAYRGVTVGCAVSLLAMDDKNESSFNHPAFLASVTKSTILIVTGLDKKGDPCEAIRYAHNFGKLVVANDNGDFKSFTTIYPELLDYNYKLILRPPREDTNRKWTNGDKTSREMPQSVIPRGARKRAEAAGLIDPAKDQLRKGIKRAIKSGHIVSKEAAALLAKAKKAKKPE